MDEPSAQPPQIPNQEALHQAFLAAQADRETRSRQTLARGFGNALLDLTDVLGDPSGAMVDPAVNPLGLVLLGFGYRARRLLRSTYRLLDENETAEAVPLVRVMLEQQIVALWLSQDHSRLAPWTANDLKQRRTAVSETLDALGDEAAEETIVALAEQIEHVEVQLAEWAKRRPGVVPRRTSLEQMAKDIDKVLPDSNINFVYQFCYRTQSQTDVHASTAAVDACFEQGPDGMLELRPAPRPSLDGYDLYAVSAHVLLDLSELIAQHFPALGWQEHLAALREGMRAVRERAPAEAAE